MSPAAGWGVSEPQWGPAALLLILAGEGDSHFERKEGKFCDSFANPDKMSFRTRACIESLSILFYH